MPVAIIVLDKFEDTPAGGHMLVSNAKYKKMYKANVRMRMIGSRLVAPTGIREYKFEDFNQIPELNKTRKEDLIQIATKFDIDISECTNNEERRNVIREYIKSHKE